MRSQNRASYPFLRLVAFFALVLATPVFGAAQDPDAEFRRLASQLSAVRIAGGEDDPVLLEKALSLLDARILNALGASRSPDLEGLNHTLTVLISENAPLSQGFQVSRLSVIPPVYALVANFGLAGPSAVRLYAGGASGVSLVARIDRATQKNYFDEYLELVPMGAAAILFVTVTGRTDDLQTGSFAAWRFTGKTLELLWSADLLQQSSYQAAADGFRLTYCSQTDDRNPRQCRRMIRERFQWDGSAWKRLEQTPVSKR